MKPHSVQTKERMNRWLKTSVQEDPHIRRILTVMLVSFALNMIGNLAIPYLSELLFLDMVGTALAAISLGPWWGATVGCLTNLVLASIPGKEQYFNYLIVNVFGGLVWGYVGRSFWNVFPRNNSDRRLFLRTLSLGATVGLVCSSTAMFTRVRFAWWLDSASVAALPLRHATDGIVKFATDRGIMKPGPTAKFLLLDAVSIIPDKVISTAFAVFVLFYFLPDLRRFVTSAHDTTNALVSRLSVIIFALVYAAPLYSIAFRGNVDVSGAVGFVSRTVMTPQVILWMVPLVAAVPALVFVDGARKNKHAGNGRKGKLKVDEVYKDVVGLVGLWYTLILTTKLPYTGAAEVASLFREGVGVAGFITISAFLPPTLARYFPVD